LHSVHVIYLTITLLGGRTVMFVKSTWFPSYETGGTRYTELVCILHSAGALEALILSACRNTASPELSLLRRVFPCPEYLITLPPWSIFSHLYSISIDIDQLPRLESGKQPCSVSTTVGRALKLLNSCWIPSRLIQLWIGRSSRCWSSRFYFRWHLLLELPLLRLIELVRHTPSRRLMQCQANGPRLDKQTAATCYTYRLA